FNIINQYLFSGNQVDIWQRITYTILTVVIAFTLQPLKKFIDKWTNKIFYQDAYDTQELLDGLNKVLVGNIVLDDLLSKSSELIGSTLKTEFTVFGIKEINNAPRRIIGP